LTSKPETRNPTLLIATTNPGKLGEIREILAGLPIDLETLAAHPHLIAPEETGTTFEENARLKALHYAALVDVPVVAEDSGLEIDALDGAPGVHSARFNGATYPEKFRALYERLRQREAIASPARFVCVVALGEGSEIRYVAHGTVEGHIAPAPRGEGGFGYDPIFFYPPFGRTLAELSPEQKAAVSHRGRAFRALRRFLERWIGEPSSTACPPAGPTP
jgi:XTP/dITP diphosphohydrolase